jgi:hypothetical protein
VNRLPEAISERSRKDTETHRPDDDPGEHGPCGDVARTEVKAEQCAGQRAAAKPYPVLSTQGLEAISQFRRLTARASAASEEPKATNKSAARAC